MGYNNTVGTENAARKRKRIRQEKREKREQKEKRIREALLKSPNPTNIEGYGLDKSDEVVKLW